jgi:hypothetical protein
VRIAFDTFEIRIALDVVESGILLAVDSIKPIECLVDLAAI